MAAVSVSVCGCFLSSSLSAAHEYQMLSHTSSFLHNPPNLLSTGKPRRRRRRRRMSIVAADRPPPPQSPPATGDNFEDVKQQIVDYFTYKAVRTVMNQLYEMNPPQYRWFYNYVASNEHGYGKTFIRKLVKDKLELAERVMLTRLHLYQRWTKFCDHTKMYQRISDQNLELMRQRLTETVIWPSDHTNSE